MNKLLLSSTGSGLKLRLKALIPLVLPLLNNLLEKQGTNILPEDVDLLVDSVFVVIAAVMHLWGWLRALKSR